MNQRKETNYSIYFLGKTRTFKEVFLTINEEKGRIEISDLEYIRLTYVLLKDICDSENDFTIEELKIYRDLFKIPYDQFQSDLQFKYYDLLDQARAKRYFLNLLVINNKL